MLVSDVMRRVLLRVVLSGENTMCYVFLVIDYPDRRDVFGDFGWLLNFESYAV